MRQLYFVATCVVVLFVQSCQRETSNEPTEKEYLFLGHTYDWLSENRIDPRLELINYDSFAGIWLGGDICARTTKDSSTLEYLTEYFPLGDTDTHWAWGNHDLMEGDENLLLGAMKRRSYYVHYDDGLLLMVLNTNLYWHHPWKPAQENCEQKEVHFQWLKEVLDTINDASHLIILHHHGLLNELKGGQVAMGNVDAIPVRPLCDSVRDFTSEIYPYLQGLEEQGTEVVLISGDVGMRSKGYEFETEEGVTLLGSGINNSLDMDYIPAYVTNLEPDSVLLLKYVPLDRQLEWSFVRLNDLVRNSPKKELAPPQDPRLRRLLSEH